MTESSIPYQELQTIAEKYKLSHVVLFASGENEDEHVVTYGVTLEQSEQAAEFGNRLKDAVGWPESLHRTSAKVLALMNWVVDLVATGFISEESALELLNVDYPTLLNMLDGRSKHEETKE